LFSTSAAAPAAPAATLNVVNVNSVPLHLVNISFADGSTFQQYGRPTIVEDHMIRCDLFLAQRAELLYKLVKMLSVFLDFNEGDTHRNHCTQRLVILRAHQN